MVMYIPERGDIVWLEFDPQKGKEIQKTRPALVISLRQYNKKTGLGLFMPISSKIKDYPFEVFIDVERIQGVVLCDQIRSLDWQVRQAQFVVSISPSMVANVLAKLQVLLD
jgi:mRNA interferase MazF